MQKNKQLPQLGLRQVGWGPQKGKLLKNAKFKKYRNKTIFLYFCIYILSHIICNIPVNLYIYLQKLNSFLLNKVFIDLEQDKCGWDTI